MKLNKKLFLMMLFISIFGVSASASMQSTSRRNVPLTMTYNNHEDPEKPKDWGQETLARRRTFFELPELSIDGYSLYFNSLCNDCDILFLRDGEVVYEDSFDFTGEYEIPSFMNGSYEIQLYVGYSIYIGTVNL